MSNLDFLKGNPALNNLSPEKLQFLMDFATNEPQGNAKSMASTLMSTVSNAKRKGMTFSPAETGLLIEILKQNMSEAECKKADQIISLMNNYRKPK